MLNKTLWDKKCNANQKQQLTSYSYVANQKKIASGKLWGISVDLDYNIPLAIKWIINFKNHLVQYIAYSVYCISNNSELSALTGEMCTTNVKRNGWFLSVMAHFVHQFYIV